MLEHHRKKQIEKEKEREKEQQERMQAMAMVPGPQRNVGGYFPRHSTPRHQPYPVQRPDRRPSTEFTQTAIPTHEQSVSIKQESADIDRTPGDYSDAEQSNSSSSNMPAEGMGGHSNIQGDSEGVNVKEEVTDSELDLEITGVELGAVPGVSQDNWAAMGVNMDSSGATGSPADMGQQGYSKWILSPSSVRLFSFFSEGTSFRKYR